jgi:hypothetical protein
MWAKCRKLTCFRQWFQTSLESPAMRGEEGILWKCYSKSGPIISVKINLVIVCDAETYSPLGFHRYFGGNKYKQTSNCTVECVSLSLWFRLKRQQFCPKRRRTSIEIRRVISLKRLREMVGWLRITNWDRLGWGDHGLTWGNIFYQSFGKLISDCTVSESRR